MVQQQAHQNHSIQTNVEAWNREWDEFENVDAIRVLVAPPVHQAIIQVLDQDNRQTLKCRVDYICDQEKMIQILVHDQRGQRRIDVGIELGFIFPPSTGELWVCVLPQPPLRGRERERERDRNQEAAAVDVRFLGLFKKENKKENADE